MVIFKYENSVRMLRDIIQTCLSWVPDYELNPELTAQSGIVRKKKGRNKDIYIVNQVFCEVIEIC